MQDSPDDLDYLDKKLFNTPLAAEHAEMQILRSCLGEGMQALNLYFEMVTAKEESLARGEPDHLHEETIRRALFRDGVIQVMSCFNSNPDKRDRFLLPEEALAGVEDWQTTYQWLHDVRDAYAAHNFGVQRFAQTVLLVEPQSSAIVAVGYQCTMMQGPRPNRQKAIKDLCEAALIHVVRRWQELETKVKEEARKLSPAEIQSLDPPHDFMAPPDAIKVDRAKYRSTPKGARRPQ